MSVREDGMTMALPTREGSPESIIDITLAGLESGLQVRHIASFGFRHCAPSAHVDEVLSDTALGQFDHIPVLQEDHCLGVLVRGTAARDGTVQDQMTPLHDAMIVAAEMPILQFMPLMKKLSYRLVLDGSRIRGIVTRSDLLKLPVRVCVFALVAHLEMVMAGRISSVFPADEEWLAHLSEGRRKKVLEKRNALKADGLDPALLSCTDICDKRDILKKWLTREDRSEAASFTRDLEAIEVARNTLAHGGDYAQDQAQLRAFLDSVQSVQQWIERLEVQPRNHHVHGAHAWST